MTRFLPFLTATLLAAGCAGHATESADPLIVIRISNAGTEPLQCRMMFGHWVDRDLGLARSGSGAEGDVFVPVRQQPQDGALYVMRADGARRMMVENIFCARPDDWQATVGQIDLATVRTAMPEAVWVSCALPENGGRMTCDKPKLTFRGSSTIVD